MTIEEFDNKAWGTYQVVKYNGRKRILNGVDSEERLLCILVPFDAFNDDIKWVRCENVELVK